MSIELQVNGQTHRVDVEPRMTLLDCLRDKLLLTGAHAGCEHGVCGACTILLDGTAVRSCLTLAVQAEGRIGLGSSVGIGKRLDSNEIAVVAKLDAGL